MMLFSMLSAAQGGKSIVFLSRHFGLSNRQMTNVIRHYLPILMRGIQKNFAKQGGLSSLLKTLDHGNYASYYEDPNIYTNPEVRNSGLSIMNQALGQEDIQRKVMHRIYLSTGIDPDTLLLVLPYVTTLALSSLYLKAHTSLAPSSMPTGLEYKGPQQQTQPQHPAFSQPARQQRPQQQSLAAPSAGRQQSVAPKQSAAPTRQQAPQQQMRQSPEQQQMPSPAQLQALQLMKQSHQYQQQQRAPQQPAQRPASVQRAMQQASQQQQQQQTAPARSQQRAPVQTQQQQPPVRPQQPQQPMQTGEPIPTPQERLPNIILQAQEAHAKKQRKQNKKGRLSRMLKAPFQVTSREQVEAPTQQSPANLNQAPAQHQSPSQAHAQQAPAGHNGVTQGGHHPAAPSYFQQQPAPQGSSNLPEPADSSKKYVSLQEKLSAQLPWYEQTG